MARISCQNQLILDAWRRYLATSWRFPVRGPFENASGHNLAIARHPGTHFASILPLPNSRERVEDMCAYPTVSVHAAAAEEPGVGACGHGGGAGGRRHRGGVGAGRGRTAAGRRGHADGDVGPRWKEPEGDGGVGAPSVERGNRRPQACAAAGRDGGGCTLRQGRGRLRAFAASGAGRRLRARPRDGAVGGGPSATRVRMNPFTPTFFRCGTVIKIICYVTNK